MGSITKPEDLESIGFAEKPAEGLIIRTCARCGLVNESAVCACGCAAMNRVEYVRADAAELERAVIEAAVTFREQCTYHDALSHSAYVSLTRAVDALLKAREKTPPA